MPHDYGDDDQPGFGLREHISEGANVNASGGYSVPGTPFIIAPYRSLAVFVKPSSGTFSVSVTWDFDGLAGGADATESKTATLTDGETLIFRNQGVQVTDITITGDANTAYVVMPSDVDPLAPSAAAGAAEYPTKYRAELWSAAFNSVREAGSFSAIRDIDRNPDGICLINVGTSATGWLENFTTYAYSDGVDAGPYVDGSELVVAMPMLGPKGSVWGIDMVASCGPDHGIIDFYWASLSDDVADAVSGYTGGNTYGLLESAFSTDNPNLAFVKVSSVDCYATVYHKSAWGGRYVSIGQFRIYGEPGDRLSAFTAPSHGDPVHLSADGGPGVWALKVKVNGKRAASTATRVGINSLSITRQSWDGFYD